MYPASRRLERPASARASPVKERSASTRQAAKLARDGRRLEDTDDTDSPGRTAVGLVRHPNLGDTCARRPHRDRGPAAAVGRPGLPHAGARDQDPDAADTATLLRYEDLENTLPAR